MAKYGSSLEKTTPSPLASVKPVTSGVSTLLAPPEFRLVSFDKLGEPQPLPAALGDLPLYDDGNGFYSVNGPLNFTIIPPCAAVAPTNRYNPTIHVSTVEISSLPGQSSRASPSHRQQCLTNDSISNSPVKGSKKRSYHCDEPGCAWRSSFPTKQALNRHREARHLNIRVDCPIEGCERVGENGIKRKDNLPAHVLNKYEIELPRRSRRN
ncbi:hypothetical protein HOY82DRAFT_625992 [Tuber indicum]|nr:hypothetical protein HOY82DRAFT_639969 [Tuber indicum]KAG0136242.1 hypothetical protein HOY82DRAFT_625992 [Tuber indicum]